MDTIFGITKKAFNLVIIFTIIETIVLVEWLILAIEGKFIPSVIFLFIGLLIEHIIATIAGTKAKPE